MELICISEYVYMDILFVLKLGTCPQNLYLLRIF
jgi:hypothetical protein